MVSNLNDVLMTNISSNFIYFPYLNCQQIMGHKLVRLLLNPEGVVVGLNS